MKERPERESLRTMTVLLAAITAFGCADASEPPTVQLAFALNEPGDSFATFYCGNDSDPETLPRPEDLDCVGRSVVGVYIQNTDPTLTQLLKERRIQWPDQEDQEWPVWIYIMDESGNEHYTGGLVPVSAMRTEGNINFAYMPWQIFRWPDVGPIWIVTSFIHTYDPSYRNAKEFQFGSWLNER